MLLLVLVSIVVAGLFTWRVGDALLRRHQVNVDSFFAEIRNYQSPRPYDWEAEGLFE